MGHLASTLMPLATVLGLGCGGCITQSAPPGQTIHVQTPGCALARCDLSNDLGQWHLDRTPGSVEVAVSRQPLKVSCRSVATEATAAALTAPQPAAAGQGAVVGGVAGGAIVGTAVGATALAFVPPLGLVAVLAGVAGGAVAGQAVEQTQRPPRYPDHVSLPMQCVGGGGMSRPGAALGLEVRGLTVEEAAAVALPRGAGVIVMQVVAGSVAQAAGLQAGDGVLALNGQPVADAADLQERLREIPRDAAIFLRIVRDGRAWDVLVAPRSGATP